MDIYDILLICTKSSDFREHCEHFTPTKSLDISQGIHTHTQTRLHALILRRDSSFILFDFIFVLAICPGA